MVDGVVGMMQYVIRNKYKISVLFEAFSVFVLSLLYFSRCGYPINLVITMSGVCGLAMFCLGAPLFILGDDI